MDILVDFETYSEVNLTSTDVGRFNYINHKSFRPICLAYMPFSIKPWKTGDINLVDYTLKPKQPCPFTVDSNTRIWAMNAEFDFSVFDRVYPGLTTIEQWFDICVVLSKFSLPQSLKQSAEVLGTSINKDPLGPLLIKKCCKKNSLTPTRQDYEALFEYCKQDVLASFEVLKCCPSVNITEFEWQLWRETTKLNRRGLPIDIESVHAIKRRVDAYKEVMQDILPEVTSGQVTKPTQTKRIKDYLNERGVKVKNVTADTLKALLAREEKKPGSLPPDCKQLVEIRQAAGASSVAKFNLLANMVSQGYVHDFIRYGATNTQRWAGSGFQVHSLAKKSVDDPEELIERFKNNGEIENPIQAAKALCRAMIKAPDGQMLYQGDYSSIEYLLLIWITDMHDMLEMFKQKKSAYIDMAAFIFNKKYEDIDKYDDPIEYFLGKQAILGCGYQMSGGRFQKMCAQYGVEIPLDLANFAVYKGFRVKYAPIKQMWSTVHRACCAAVLNPGHKYETCKCSFVSMKDHNGLNWLIITLPSKSSLYYAEPSISQGKYGPELSHKGLYKHNWIKRALSPGRLTENIIQKLARDLIAYSFLQVEADSRFSTLMLVHDEVVSIGSDEDPEGQLKDFHRLLEKTPPHLSTIPLRVDGYYSKRYKKD